MSEISEAIERVDEVTSTTKGLALIFAVMALFFAMSEGLSRGAQTIVDQANINASDLRTFYQAQSTNRALAGTMIRIVETDVQTAATPAIREAKEKLLADLRQSYDRYESAPDTMEGRRELVARAREAEHDRALATSKLRDYQLASSAFQTGMWLAFAGIITGMTALGFMSCGIGVVGLMLMALGLFAPQVTLIH
jgi:Domain of unknown function (DUF4337)